MDTTCLYTTIRNTSGETRKFVYLPPRGVELGPDDEFTFIGNPTEAIQAAFPGGRAKRYLRSFEAALLAGDLTIVSTPAPILYDPVLEETRMVQLENGSLVTAVPCWEASVSP